VIQSPAPDQTDAAEFRAMIAGVCLSVVGFATFLLMPQFIEAAVADLGYSEPQVGNLSAVVSVGSTLAAIAAVLWIRSSSWRWAGALALAGLIASNVLSMFVHGFAGFIALQGIAGFCGGSIYSLALTVLSDGRRPQRYFAYAIGAQTIYQIVGLAAGPALIHQGGVNAILGVFTGLGILGLALIAGVPTHGRTVAAPPRARSRGEARAHGGLLSPAVMLALAGCFLYYVNVGAYWTYIERIGVTAGIGLSEISNGLAFGTAASMLGVLLASWLGERRGYVVPIAWSAIGVVLAVVLLLGHLRLTAYVISAVVYGIVWNVSMTYQYSAVNIVDRTRRGVALAPAFHDAGGAVGPALAALAVTEKDHSSVLWIVILSVLGSWACFAVALRLHARSAARGVAVLRAGALP
jgi:predicted MFS family arabinose efflux permease